MFSVEYEDVAYLVGYSDYPDSAIETKTPEEIVNSARDGSIAALEGKLDKADYRKDKLFGFEVPKTCPDVPEDVLEPSSAWGNKDEYWKKYDALAARYIENFKLFREGCPKEVAAAGPKRLK